MYAHHKFRLNILFVTQMVLSQNHSCFFFPITLKLTSNLTPILFHIFFHIYKREEAILSSLASYGIVCVVSLFVCFFLGVSRLNYKVFFLRCQVNDLQGRKLTKWRGVISACILWHSGSVILLKPGNSDVLKQLFSVIHYSYFGICSLFIVYAVITSSMSFIPKIGLHLLK